jgi:hypothetical protein
MNGWQRLFVVLTACISMAGMALWLISKPASDGRGYAYGCYESNISYVSIKDADVHLRTTPGLAFECKKSLAEIASGKSHQKSMNSWYGDLKVGAVTVSVFLAMVYALGWAAGWIWRGFFPKKSN